ncbi:MAG: hypothetical protein IPK20_26010 [Betaproteobacteria bacterium]|nr:hypothetical protein [Betaproteobacteria bacterium]
MPMKPRGSGKPKRNEVALVIENANDNADDVTARTLTRPEVQAAAVIQRFEGDNHDVNALVRELTAQADAIRRGDLGRVETMLIAQAHTLDEIFANLSRRSHANIVNGYGDAAERYMRLALKAQSQCRTTLETLAEIKNPKPVAFVGQANFANGPQQVNNQRDFATSSRGRVRAEDSGNSMNEVLNNRRLENGGLNDNEVGPRADGLGIRSAHNCCPR